MLSYTFKNGTVVNGTLEQILQVAEILGEKVDNLEEIPSGYYPSSSRGLVRIEDMNEVHIKNAINKIAYTYYQNLGKEDIDIGEYCARFVLLAEEPKLQELYGELLKRSKS